MRARNALIAIAALGLAAAVSAQTQQFPPPSGTQGAPQPSQQASGPTGASSPHQRTVTGQSGAETTPNTNPNPAAASSPHQRIATRMASADTGGVVSSGMTVQDRSGQAVGTVADVVAGRSGHPGYVIVEGRRGTATPMPYRVASSMAKDGKIVVDRTAFRNAPRIKKSNASGRYGTRWHSRVDQYWERFER